MRTMMLASMAAAAMLADPRRYQVTDDDFAVGLRLAEPPDADMYLSAPVPRRRHAHEGSKYMPHQGAREMERRRKRLAKASA